MADEQTTAESAAEEATVQGATELGEDCKGNDNVDAQLDIAVNPGLNGSVAAFFKVRSKKQGEPLVSVSLSFRLVDSEGVETESLGGTTFNLSDTKASGNAGITTRIIPRIDQPQAVLSGLINTAEGQEMFFFVKDIDV